jgi:hypothetical protein
MTQMRNLTCCSYVLLIVDRRNITGRHRPGNAGVSSQNVATTNTESLLTATDGVFTTPDVGT